MAGKIKEGDVNQSNWYLERKGKDEGFSSRQELTGKDGGKIELDVTKASDEDLYRLVNGNNTST